MKTLQILTLCLFFFHPAVLPASPYGDAGCQNDRIEGPGHQANVELMARQLEDYLEERATNLAIVARVGSDLSEEKFQNPAGQKYTHAGFAWKSSRDGRWRFKHLLNCGGDGSSRIYVQPLELFFDDGPYMYDFLTAVPSARLQGDIVAVLESPLALALHHAEYSKISHPFNTQYQNSNEWLLSVIAAAQSGELENFRQAQGYYKEQGYHPSQVYLNWFRQMGTWFRSDVSLGDHTWSERLGGWFHFASAASLLDYISGTDTLLDAREVCHPAGCGIPLERLNR